MGTLLRDNQRAAVYRWERGLPDGRAFPTIPECQTFIDEVWEEWGTGSPPTARTIGGYRAWASRWEIDLPEPTRFERYLLHEITHSLQHCDLDITCHGPTFASMYVFLLEEYGVITSAQHEKERGYLQRPRKVRFL